MFNEDFTVRLCVDVDLPWKDFFKFIVFRWNSFIKSQENLLDLKTTCRWLICLISILYRTKLILHGHWNLWHLKILKCMHHSCACKFKWKIAQYSLKTDLTIILIRLGALDNPFSPGEHSGIRVTRMYERIFLAFEIFDSVISLGKKGGKYFFVWLHLS